MIFTREQVHKAYKNLSLETQGLVTSAEAAEAINSFAGEAKIAEEHHATVDKEIFYAMIGLQTLNSALNNISSDLHKPLDLLKRHQPKLQQEIFDHLPHKGLAGAAKKEEKEAFAISEPKVSRSTASIETYSSHLPAIEEGEVAHDVKPSSTEPAPEPTATLASEPVPSVPPPVSQAPQPSPAPASAPISKPETNEPSTTPEAPKPQIPTYKSHYPDGQDPYREPLN